MVGSTINNPIEVIGGTGQTNEIIKATGVSTATITRINQWLRHGRGGYHEALVRMHLQPEESA